MVRRRFASAIIPSSSFPEKSSGKATTWKKPLRRLFDSVVQ
jgi:hypothetical protein